MLARLRNMAMIAPTGRAVALAGAGAPVALLLAVFEPRLWLVAPAWAALCLALVLFDAMIAPPLGKAQLALDAPQSIGVGELFDLVVRVATGGHGRPRDAAVAVALDTRLAPLGRIDAPLKVDDGEGIAARFSLNPRHRGILALTRAWIGWSGPWGLGRRQRAIPLDRTIAVAPSIRTVREEGAKLFARDALVGQRLHARLGEGSEFESLVRFMPGLDRRAIDWKQSARHTDLLAKQFETEKDNRIVLAIDSGRMMSEPLVAADGLAEPRLDRAVSAALTLGYVALRMEDRVSLVSFAARAGVVSREFSRIGDFAALRRTAAAIDYGLSESNYTLGLAQIGASLKRRAMIVIFTEFADATSAELMIRAAERLVTRHLVLFVVMVDSELEGIAAKIPSAGEDVAAATIAAELLRDRRVVLTRLRRMGALVVEAQPDGMSASLLATYIRVKRQGMI